MPIYILAAQVEKRTVLLINKDNAFNGSENLEEAKKLLPDYNGYHAAGAVWSTSATINWMTFQPCLIEFESFDELKEQLLDSTIRMYHNFSGSITGTELKPDYVPNIVERGKLIDENVSTAKPFYER